MNTFKEQEGIYLSSFTQLESTLNKHAPAWLPALRRAAIESFAELGFPTTHDEEWLYTNVAPLASTPFVRDDVKLTDEIRQRIGSLPLADLGCSRLTFLNGRYVPELSKLRDVPTGIKAAISPPPGRTTARCWSATSGSTQTRRPTPSWRSTPPFLKMAH